jgi:radical SAM protein with 4Fe4S-binding SPASM domain
VIPPHETGFMDIALYRKIIDEASAFPRPTFVLLYLGGEPLLHNGLLDMIEYAAKTNIFVQFNSNAALLTPELIEGLLDSELELIVFSFDDMLPEQYEALRKNGSYSKTLANILAFLKRKKEKQIKYPNVMIAPLKYYDPSQELSSQQCSASFLELFADYQVFFGGNIIQSWAGGFEIVDGKLTKEHLGRSDYETVRVKRFPKCVEPWQDFVVNYRGDVVACCYDLKYQCIVGNVKKQSIMDIWNGKKMQDLRRILVKKQFDKLPLCASCSTVKGEGVFAFPAIRNF